MSCVDDIEDLASTVGDTPTKRAPRKRVIPKKFSTQLKHESPVAESVIPGTQSVGQQLIVHYLAHVFSIFSSQQLIQPSLNCLFLLFSFDLIVPKSRQIYVFRRFLISYYY